jgi:hypothetical protein
VNKDQANPEKYVTQKTLDGLYLMMAEEAIRKVCWGWVRARTSIQP